LSSAQTVTCTSAFGMARNGCGPICAGRLFIELCDSGTSHQRGLEKSKKFGCDWVQARTCSMISRTSVKVCAGEATIVCVTLTMLRRRDRSPVCCNLSIGLDDAKLALQALLVIWYVRARDCAGVGPVRLSLRRRALRFPLPTPPFKGSIGEPTRIRNPIFLSRSRRPGRSGRPDHSR
jgi:hypothetical protein